MGRCAGGRGALARASMTGDPLARYLAAQGMVEEAQLRAAVASTAEQPAGLPQLLLREGLLDHQQLRAALEAVGRTRAEPNHVGDVAPGQVLGGCLIESEIARGGMGVVFRALQLGIGRPVALKLQLQGRLAEADRLRFEREARMMSRLQHPNIPRVYGSGTLRDGVYYTMALVDGPDLAARIRDGSMPLEETVGALARLADALAAAHDEGMIHRDIKASNMMFDAGGTPFLVDFGLALPLTPERTSDQVTRTGAILGTLPCLAPELAEGERATGPTTDIYAFGVTLYQAVTGEYPYCATTVYELLRDFQQTRPRPREVVPSLPEPLERIILQAMALHPQDRYQTARELAADLERFRAGRPVQARVPGRRWSPSGRPAGGGRSILLAGTLLALCLAALALYRVAGPKPAPTATPQAAPGQRPAEPAVKPAPADPAADAARAIAQGQFEPALRLLERLSRQGPQARGECARLLRGPAVAERLLAVDPERAAGLCGQVLPWGDPMLKRCHALLSRRQAGLGTGPQHGEQQRALLTALELLWRRRPAYPKLTPAQRARLDQIYNGLRGVLVRSGREQQALRYFEQLEREHPRDPCLPQLVGMLYRDRLHVASSPEEGGRATRLAIAALSRAIPLVLSQNRLPMIYYHRAGAYHQNQQADLALADYTMTTRLAPRHWFGWAKRADLRLHSLDDPAAALADYQQALACKPKAVHDRAELQFHLGLCEHAIGKTRTGLARMRAAYRAYRRARGLAAARSRLLGSLRRAVRPPARAEALVAQLEAEPGGGR